MINLYFLLMKLNARLEAKTSLKRRLIAVLLLNSLLPLTIIGYISYYTLLSIRSNKIDRNINSTLDVVRTSLEGSLENIGNITKQFTYEGTLGLGSSNISDIQKYMEYKGESSYFTDDDIFRVSEFDSNLSKRMLLIGASNPVIGLISFYAGTGKDQVASSGENRFIISNMKMNTVKKTDMSEFPLLLNTDEVKYHFPHKSVIDNKSYVVSVSRKADLVGIDNLYVYIETNPAWLSGIMNKSQYGMEVFHFIQDKEGRVVFSEMPETIRAGDTFKPTQTVRNTNLNDRYIFFKSVSKDGWSIYAAVLKADYYKELRKWFGHIFLIGGLSVVFSALLAALIWKTVYRPIRAFGKEIRLMKNHREEPRIRITRVKEFDELLLEFYEMRKYTKELIEQIEQKEKQKKELEIEKLMVQINPHFIYNTLNSMQWLARINHQKDLEKMASKFSQVLGYGLGKNSIIVTLRDEIEALMNYIELQELRYRNLFKVQMIVEPALYDMKIPRFILQPIIENAIYHRMEEDDAEVSVNITLTDDEHFRIVVKDNGEGMTQEEIKRLSLKAASSDRKDGLGIGLRYVDRMIKFYYGDIYSIQIESEKGKGTSVIMLLPCRLKEETE